MNYEEIAEFDTNLTADVVAWRPIIGESSTNLACGTYFLDKEKNKRLGSLYILNLEKELHNLKLIDTFNFNDSGILDMKWFNSNKLLTIDSNNNLKLLDFNDNKIQCIETKYLGNESIGLTIDYLSDTNNHRILTSDTKGYINLTKLNDNKFDCVASFQAHELEIWSVLLDRFSENIVYSGADDCFLKSWDLRDQKCVSKCNIFQGGVVSILSPGQELNNYNENHLICGSYDEKIYVLDKRNLKRSINESKKLNGGVWKMKTNKSRDLLLCACMHTGVHLVNAATLNSELYYAEHGLDNLAYGCDWNYEFDDIIASCSFYNHNLRVWKLK